jgi:hypothetical protein
MQAGLYYEGGELAAKIVVRLTEELLGIATLLGGQLKVNKGTRVGSNLIMDML